MLFFDIFFLSFNILKCLGSEKKLSVAKYRFYKNIAFFSKFQPYGYLVVNKLSVRYGKYTKYNTDQRVCKQLWTNVLISRHEKQKLIKYFCSKCYHIFFRPSVIRSKLLTCNSHSCQSSASKAYQYITSHFHLLLNLPSSSFYSSAKPLSFTAIDWPSPSQSSSLHVWRAARNSPYLLQSIFAKISLSLFC